MSVYTFNKDVIEQSFLGCLPTHFLLHNTSGLGALLAATDRGERLVSVRRSSQLS